MAIHIMASIKEMIIAAYRRQRLPEIIVGRASQVFFIDPACTYGK